MLPELGTFSNFGWLHAHTLYIGLIFLKAGRTSVDNLGCLVSSMGLLDLQKIVLKLFDMPVYDFLAISFVQEIGTILKEFLGLLNVFFQHRVYLS